MELGLLFDLFDVYDVVVGERKKFVVEEGFSTTARQESSTGVAVWYTRKNSRYTVPTFTRL